MLFSASQHMPPVSAPSPTTATTGATLAAHVEGLGQPVGVGQRGRGVRVLDPVVRALGAAGVAGQAAALAQRRHLRRAAGEDLVDVGLVADVRTGSARSASRRRGAARWSARPRRGWGRGARRCGRRSARAGRGSPPRAWPAAAVEVAQLGRRAEAVQESRHVAIVRLPSGSLRSTRPPTRLASCERSGGGRLERRDALDVVRHRERVEGPQRGQPPAGLAARRRRRGRARPGRRPRSRSPAGAGPAAPASPRARRRRAAGRAPRRPASPGRPAQRRSRRSTRPCAAPRACGSVGEVVGGVGDRRRVGLQAERRARHPRPRQRARTVSAPAPAYRSSTALARPRRDERRAARRRTSSAACGCTCQNPPARHLQVAAEHPRGRSRAGPATTRTPVRWAPAARLPAARRGRCSSTATVRTGPAAPARRRSRPPGRRDLTGRGKRGRVGHRVHPERAVRRRARHVVRAVPAQPDARRPARPRTGCACASRAGRRAAPRPRSAGPARPGGPAARTARARRSSLSSRWAAASACCQSQPPQRPGPAYGHGGSTRSGAGSSTSTASAKQYEPPRSCGDQRRAPARPAARAARTPRGRPGRGSARRRCRRARDRR